MSNVGSSDFNLFHARCLISSSLKSQCLPSSSCVVKSKANPGRMPYDGQSFAMAETLGGEYISLTMARNALPRSRLYLLPLPPRSRTKLRISSFISFICLAWS